ncbi:MAG: ubiquinone/menaquinone biosynthesis methyltransferase [Chloroflexi bacterium]|nr:ubiquinone/menaquinone biosynthesis methyltransferase [Chloroflexota bacterium]
MFGRIARRYDLLNGMLSWCQAQSWRRAAAELAAPGLNGPALDVATGTGDLAFELARLGRGQVVALDFNQEMLALARAKAAETDWEDRLTFVLGDAHELPFPDHAFASATIAFGLRNVISPPRAFAELRRVVATGGRIVCLELVQPSMGLTAAFYHLYLDRIVPHLGRCVSGDGEAYRYLPESVRAFLTARQLQELMEGAGLRGVWYQTLNWGTVAIHVGCK